jgi:hypothetical protein
VTQSRRAARRGALLARVCGALILAALPVYGSRALAEDLAVVGGTILDLSDAGRATQDVRDAAVLIHAGKIVYVGPRRKLRAPPDTKIVDATGMYIVPGLIDGFGSLRNQGFADAYLYEGVTTVVVVQAPAGADGETGLFAASEGPRIIRMATIGGYEPDGSVPQPYPWLTGQRALPAETLEKEMRARAAAGFRGFMLGWDVEPSQLTAVVRSAHLHQLATIGEFARTPYPDAADAGVNAFLRADHYLTALAPPAVLEAYRKDPAGKGAGPAYRAVCTIDVHSDAVQQSGRMLAATGAALMPILSLEATADDVGAANPWLSRSSMFVVPADLDDPVDPRTNARPYLEQHPDRRQALQDCVRSRQRVDGELHRLGVLYLAGSGSPAYGVMPGGGLHQELMLLQSIGLTPREALAAATGNFARVYGWTDVGVIEPGRSGDVLVVGSDPRTDVAALSDIRTVVHDGRVIDRARLEARATQSRH